MMRSEQCGSARGYRVEQDQAVERRTMTAEAGLAGSKAVHLLRAMIHHKHRSRALAGRPSYNGYTKVPPDRISVSVVYIHSMKGFSAFAFPGSDVIVSRPSEMSKSELEEQKTALSREDKLVEG